MMRPVYAAMILLLLLVTFHGNYAKEIYPLAIHMSSVWKGWHKGYRELEGSLCMDNNYGIISICHTAGGETWPWVAVEIPQGSSVNDVKIFNRNDCCGERTRNVKIWVGDSLPTTTDTEYSQGSYLWGDGMDSPWKTGEAANYPLRRVQDNLHGRYVIVQMTGTDYINLAEIKVYDAPAPRK